MSQGGMPWPGERARVPVGAAYDVVIGHDLLGAVGELLPPTAARALLVHTGRLPEVVARCAGVVGGQGDSGR
jgi:3-dehydroquinate synthase